MLKAHIYVLTAISTLMISPQKNDLHNTRISGTIEKLSFSIEEHKNSDHYTTLKVGNRIYRLIITSASGNEFSFIDVARVRDTIFKAQNNDTLFVKRVGFNSNIRLPFIAKGYIAK